MFKVRQKWLSVVALLFLVIPALPAAPVSLAQGDSHTFPETGKTVKGKFLTYWQQHGGLAQQGYPISEELQEASPTDGKTYTMQYFERAVFELHPENQAPNDVLLSLLGNFQYKQKYPSGAPNQKVSTAAGAVKFSQTGHTVGGKFLTYWQQHGGLAQQGYPISDEFTEVSGLNGKPYTVQYFERAVFEMHPENQSPNDVLLSQLGTFQYRATHDLSFTDFTGTRVTLPKRPQKIVCLVGLCEDILHELGLEPAAVNDKLYQLPQFWGPSKTFPAIGGGFAAPNLEDIARIQPDLVIGFMPHVGLRDALKTIAPLYIMNPAKYQDSIDYLRTMGRLTGRSAQAEASIKKFMDKIAAYKAKSPNNKVPLLLFGNDANFSIFTEGSLVGSVLAAATNYPWPAPGPNDKGAPDAEPGSLQYSLERVLQKDPDVLLAITRGTTSTGQTLSQILAANPIWSQLKAVQNNQAYDVSFQLYVAGRGTVSLGAALDDAMHRIYPDTFPNPLP